MKRRKTVHMNGEDRLSSLPDALLVDILSFLPLHSAIVTDVLSKRWRHLWTQITSVVIDDRIIKLKYDNLTSLDLSIYKLTSPFIHTFIVDFVDIDANLAAKIPIESWLGRFCQRQVGHLAVSLRSIVGRHLTRRTHKVQVPPCIFKTRSLVSIKLKSEITIRDNDDLIDLPNLSCLCLNLTPSQCGWLNKLAESCPWLQELWLDFKYSFKPPAIDIELSCPNLKRLSLYLGYNRPCKVVINAPKLEYLYTCFLLSTTTFCIRDKPIKLHEVKVGTQSYMFHHLRYSDDGDGCNLGFYEAISYVRTLTINSFAPKAFTIFPNLTRLTLILDYFPCKFMTVAWFLRLCPVLQILTLILEGRPIFDDDMLRKIRNLGALERVKKIKIDICYDEHKLVDCFSEMIRYLLKSSSILKHFCFSVHGGRLWGKETAKETIARYEKGEYELCDLLYKCPRASIDCEVLFTGKCLLMSRKAGSNALRADGVAIPIK
ncbi:hypothetical protein vseg_016563 [Gypsophila vaccaria]